MFYVIRRENKNHAKWRLDGLLNRCTGKTVPGVRIPLSPPFQPNGCQRVRHRKNLTDVSTLTDFGGKFCKSFCVKPIPEAALRLLLAEEARSRIDGHARRGKAGRRHRYGRLSVITPMRCFCTGFDSLAEPNSTI